MVSLCPVCSSQPSFCSDVSPAYNPSNGFFPLAPISVEPGFWYFCWNSPAKRGPPRDTLRQSSWKPRLKGKEWNLEFFSLTHNFPVSRNDISQCIVKYNSEHRNFFSKSFENGEKQEGLQEELAKLSSLSTFLKIIKQLLITNWTWSKENKSHSVLSSKCLGQTKGDNIDNIHKIQQKTEKSE